MRKRRFRAFADFQLADELAGIAGSGKGHVHAARAVRAELRARGESVPAELELIADGVWARGDKYPTGPNGARMAADDALLGLAEQHREQG